MRVWTTLALIGLLCYPATARADTWLVDAAGTGDFTAIQDAVDAAAPGDRIEILAGTYVEAVDLVDKPLDIIGVDGAGVTFIEGVEIGLQAAFNPGSSVAGLTITDCDHGAYVHSYSMVTFTDMVFSYNSAPDMAGGLAVVGGAFVHVAWSRFEGNSGSNAAGAVLVTDEAMLYLQETAVESNSAASGGAISVIGNAMMMTSECHIDNNTATDMGGAIFAEGSAVLITGGTLNNNATLSVDGVGGAIVGTGSWIDLEHVEVMGNQAANGGALAAGEGQLQVGNSLIMGNTADNSGGGILGMSLVLFLLDSTVAGNTVLAPDGYGGGLVMMDSEVAVYNSWLCSNSAASGGAMIAMGGVTEMYNCRLAENMGGTGIGALGAVDVELWLQNNDFVDNQGAIDHLYVTENEGVSSGAFFNTHFVGGTGIAICDESTAGLEVFYNDFWDTPVSFACNNGGLTPQDVGEGNTEHDPGFVAWTADGDCSNDDLHLQAGSLSIDGGHPDAQLNDPDGSRSDIGSYGGPTAPVDLDGDGSTVLGGDCDDGNPDVYPGAAEICDGLDNNCDEEIPEEEGIDGDGDGFPVCDDCDDEDAGIHRDADEICDDEIDNDCDGDVDGDDPDCQGDDDDDDDATDDDDDDSDDDDDDDDTSAADDDVQIADTNCKCTQQVGNELGSPAAALILAAGALGLLRRRRIDI